MARGQVSAVSRLARLHEERAELDAREAKLRAEVAAELSEALLRVGGERIDAAVLGRIVKAVLAIGEEEALKRLEATA